MTKPEIEKKNDEKSKFEQERVPMSHDIEVMMAGLRASGVLSGGIQDGLLIDQIQRDFDKIGEYLEALGIRK